MTQENDSKSKVKLDPQVSCTRWKTTWAIGTPVLYKDVLHQTTTDPAVNQAGIAAIEIAPGNGLAGDALKEAALTGKPVELISIYPVQVDVTKVPYAHPMNDEREFTELEMEIHEVLQRFCVVIGAYGSTTDDMVFALCALFENKQDDKFGQYP